jgi:hypothetical protein
VWEVDAESRKGDAGRLEGGRAVVAQLLRFDKLKRGEKMITFSKKVHLRENEKHEKKKRKIEKMREKKERRITKLLELRVLIKQRNG